MTRPRVAVTGGAGFIGCNLADALAGLGCEVTVLDSLARPGVEANLAWLQSRHADRVRPLVADIRDPAAVRDAVAGAGAVFHLAAQVAVTTSLDDPRFDFEVNLGGTLNVLEAVRRAGGRAPVIFASTNKVYGALDDVAFEIVDGAWRPTDPTLQRQGVDESRPLDFHTPYGCSKGGSDQYVLDYARSFSVPACVLRMSCIYGARQLGTEDQGWVAHFLIRALAGRAVRVFGDGRQVRDVLCVQDAVAAYLAAWRRIDAVAGRAFNLGGGPENAISLLALIAWIEELLGSPVKLEFGPWRAGDQRWYVSDTRAAARVLALERPTPWRRGVRDLALWLDRQGERQPLERVA